MRQCQVPRELLRETILNRNRDILFFAHQKPQTVAAGTSVVGDGGGEWQKITWRKVLK
jgi:hypothetical protein